jgi:hypothetical protein
MSGKGRSARPAAGWRHVGSWGGAGQFCLFPSESMMFVFTDKAYSLAVTAVTVPCDLLATAGCDEGHRFDVPWASKVGREST